MFPPSAEIVAVSSEITTLVVAAAYRDTCIFSLAMLRKLGELQEQRYGNRSNRIVAGFYHNSPETFGRFQPQLTQIFDPF